MNVTALQPRPFEQIAAEFYGTNLSKITCDTSIIIHGGEAVICDGSGFRLKITREVGDAHFGLENHYLYVLPKPNNAFWSAQIAYHFPDTRDGPTETLLRQCFTRWKHPLQIIEKPGMHDVRREEELGHGFIFRSKLHGSFVRCEFESSITVPDGSVCYRMLGAAGMT